MKAVQLSRFGGPEVLELVDVPRPEPGPRELLVRVQAAGVNFADTQIRQNRYPMMPPLPAILGMEVAGTVESAGSGATSIPVGTRVAAALFAGGKAGGYSEYVVVSQDHVVPLPERVSFADATALMIQGLTALYMIRRVDPRGKTVLVTAAAGGVGTLLVQLARNAGAKTVIGAVGSPEKRELVTSLGASACVSYGKPDWVAEARAANGGAGFDLILESVGGDVMPACLTALALKGEIVLYGALNFASFALGPAELGGLVFGNQSVTGFGLNSLLTDAGLREGLTELLALVNDRKIKIVSGGSYAFADAGAAHRALEERKTTGKVNLQPVK